MEQPQIRGSFPANSPLTSRMSQDGLTGKVPGFPGELSCAMSTKLCVSQGGRGRVGLSPCFFGGKLGLSPTSSQTSSKQPVPIVLSVLHVLLPCASATVW